MAKIFVVDFSAEIAYGYPTMSAALTTRPAKPSHDNSASPADRFEPVSARSSGAAGRAARAFGHIGRRDRCPRGPAWVLAGLLWLGASPAEAVLFYSTADPSYNTSAPTSGLAGSGWQYEGLWGSFLGTVIAPKYFITAHHVGGNVGDPFIFGGMTYLTSAVFDDPDSDLRIWRVCGTFPTNAPLYTATNEVGRDLVVVGRGTQRGDPVSASPGFTNGWRWGALDGVQRWGENTVDGIISGDQIEPAPSHLGWLLQAAFDAGAGPNEGTLSTGDSGGGVFIQDGTVWKLAGINYAADGLFNTTNTGPGFLAAVFDARGLYEGGPDNWSLVPFSRDPVPGAFYATRIASNLNWILSVIATAPPDNWPVLQSAPGIAGPYADDPNAVVDAQAGTITLAGSAAPQFYRLRACGPLTITDARLDQGNLVLTYRAP